MFRGRELALAALPLLALLLAGVLLAYGALARAQDADPYPSTYVPGPRADTLIRGATVLDGAGHRLDGADMLMADGRIAAVGRGLAPPVGGRVIEAHGRWVTPGIVDMHSHDGDFTVPMTPDSLADVSELSDPIHPDVISEHSIAPQDPGFRYALSGGVTTLLILPGSDDLIGGRGVVVKPVWATTVQAMKFPAAPDALKMACGENPKSFYGDKDKAPTSRMGEIAMDRQAFIQAREYEDRWARWTAHHADDDQVRGAGHSPPDDRPDHGHYGDPPPARDLKLETLAAVLDGQVRVQMHCYKAEEMAVMLDLAHEMGFRISAFHHAVEAYKIAPLLKREGVCAAVWPDWWGYKMEALDGIRENAAYLDAQGVCVALHSDGPIVGQRLTVEAGKAMAAGRRAGLDVTPERAIAWVTSNPAHALGLDDRIGTLAPGKDADVTIWSGDPFSIYTHADQVFIDGAQVFDRANPAANPNADFELGQPARQPVGAER